MIKYIPLISTDIVFNLLPHSIRESTSIGDLTEDIKTSSLKFARKRFFRLHREGGLDIHLSFGRELEVAFERAKSFYQAIPKHACKPLFINKSNDYMLFGQEFFQGLQIDKIYEKSEITISQVENIILQIKDIFSGIEKASTNELKQMEFDAFCKLVMGNEMFSKNDISIIENEIFPLIKNGFFKEEPTIRWSSGDLSARNILVSNEQEFKIIDCEFAQNTHFHQEDWIRLSTFASKSFRDISCIKKIKDEISYELQLYHMLRQTVLNRYVYEKSDYEGYLQCDLNSLLKKVNDKSKTKSQILKGLSNHNRLLEEKINLTTKTNIELAQNNSGLIDLNTKLSDQNLELLTINSKVEKEKNLVIKKKEKIAKEHTEFKKEIIFHVQEKSKLKKEKNKLNDLNSELDKLNSKLDKLNCYLVEKNIRTSNENRQLADFNVKFIEKNSKLLEKLEGQTDKVLRMQNSFSWKITSPFRFLRRITLDKLYKRQRLPKKDRIVSGQENDYNRWILLYDKINEKRLNYFKNQALALDADILFSIVIPVYNPPIKFLRSAINSVLKQVYKNWELCISDDCSSDPTVISFLKDLSVSDPRIKINFRKKNGHISACSNSALDLSTGEYVVLLDHDDELRPHSLLRFAQNIHRNPKLQFLYSDEDKINEENTRFEPYFKPDWNPDLLLSQNYICHLACIKRSLISQNGGFRVGYEGSQDWDLFLRVTEKLKSYEIFHIPEILYHWRSYSSSTASSLENKTYAVHAAKKSLKDYLLRNKINGEISKLNEKANYWKIVYKIPAKAPLVSIIIPTKDKKDILKVCIDSIVSKTKYSNYEILIVDNGTTDPESKSYLYNLNKEDNVKVTKVLGEFNYSKLNNSAAKNAKGEVLLLLNNDIEVVSENWLEIMVSHALRPEIGCVGAKLLYPNSTIQHAGVILGIGGVAGHIYKGFPANAHGQFSRLLLTQNFQAVTGACLAVKKSIFEEVGGLNEKNLKVAFNDVDFCLRVGQSGYNNILDPSVVLFHHESYSRGLDTEGKKRIRFEEEVKYMNRKWGKQLHNDSCYSPNLSLEKEDTSLAFPPRVAQLCYSIDE